jgi:hypothetical protein
LNQDASANAIFRAVPPDDSGAETQARYRYQAEVASRYAFRMLSGEVAALLCEWHEDFVVFLRDAGPELISVKHREVDQGPWTLAGLLTDGGVAHLFSRWKATGKSSRCRLSTNAGLATDARPLAKACEGREAKEISEWADKCCIRLGADASEVAAFLGVLTIESGLPPRQYITASNVESFARPVLSGAGYDVAIAGAAYSRIVKAIEDASTDQLTTPEILVAYLGDPSRILRDVRRDLILDSRTLDVYDIREAISAAGASLRPRIAFENPAGATKLVAKLLAGGFGPTHIESAQRLRAAWTEFEAAYSVGLPGDDRDLADLRARVLAEAGDAESEARRAVREDEPYGLEMYRLVLPRLRPDLLVSSRALPTDERLLQGLMFQLTDECPVWWSPAFEVSPA